MTITLFLYILLNRDIKKNIFSASNEHGALNSFLQCAVMDNTALCYLFLFLKIHILSPKFWFGEPLVNVQGYPKDQRSHFTLHDYSTLRPLFFEGGFLIGLIYCHPLCISPRGGEEIGQIKEKGYEKKENFNFVYLYDSFFSK